MASTAAIDDAKGRTRPAARAGDDVPRGILLMVGATVMLTLANVFSKILVARYPVGEVMFGRSAIAFALSCALVLPGAGLRAFATRRPGAHVARGLSQAVSQTLTVLALGLMPLAGVTAIGFSAPLFAALVAILWCREPADPVRWAMLLTGFVGVLVVTNPGAETLQLGALFAVGNAVMYGTVTVAVRSMTKTESAATLLLWQMAVMTVAHAGLLAFGFTWPGAADAGLFVLLGASTVGAQFLWTRALAAAPATAVSPFYYLMLVWGMGIGAVAFGEIPDAHLLVGAAIVVASGLLLLWHETAAKRGTAPPWGRLVERLARRAPSIERHRAG
ncbi:DMT family transporter [uncultured Methylobacterium sp.]|jgi:drug/metabolite transporter (DMT)-like permease|uniref:DMT family transporter n=1 Tax=uncultured Methylobacterium sp. TaxID=157278 RepID=UPI0026117023|nr:DMT family transporter [uncultured Methylobacterium sp.]